MSRPADDAEAACQRLVIKFAHDIDHRRFAEAAALFADDGVWDRHGDPLVGPAAIHELLQQRPESQVERHMMTTILVSRTSDRDCAAVSYVQIFRKDVGAEGPADMPAAVLGEFHDRFRLTTDGWRFTYRTSLLVFVNGAE